MTCSSWFRRGTRCAGTTTVVGTVLAVVSAFSWPAALQRGYELAWGLPSLGWRALWRPMLWLATFIVVGALAGGSAPVRHRLGPYGAARGDRAPAHDRVGVVDPAPAAGRARRVAPAAAGGRRDRGRTDRPAAVRGRSTCPRRSRSTTPSTGRWGSSSSCCPGWSGSAPCCSGAPSSAPCCTSTGCGGRRAVEQPPGMGDAAASVGASLAGVTTSAAGPPASSAVPPVPDGAVAVARCAAARPGRPPRRRRDRGDRRGGAGDRVADRAGVHGADHRHRRRARAELAATPGLAGLGDDRRAGPARLRDHAGPRAGHRPVHRSAGHRVAAVRLEGRRTGGVGEDAAGRARRGPRAAPAGRELIRRRQPGGGARRGARERGRAGDEPRVPAGAAAVPQRGDQRRRRTARRRSPPTGRRSSTRSTTSPGAPASTCW